MGLLDSFFGSPEQTQALGLLGASMMKGKTADGLLAAQQYMAQAPDRNLERQHRQMQLQALQGQLEDQQRARQQQQMMQDAVRSSMLTPEKAQSLSMGPMPNGAEPPTVQPGFNPQAYTQALYGIDPMKAVAFQQAIAKDESPLTVAPGASLVDRHTMKPVFTAPKEATPTEVNKLISEMNALPPGHPFRKVYEAAIQKATTHQPPTNVNLAVNTDKSYFGNLAEGLAKNDVALIDAGRSAPDRIASSQRVRQILSQNPITGTGAESRLALNKALATAGVIDGKTVADTETLASMLASQTLDAIKTSGLGSGQGFTDKDRQFLERAKSGNIEMNSVTLGRLADLNEQSARHSIQRANSVIGKLRSSPEAGRMGQQLDPIPEPAAPKQAKTVVRQGMYGGRKVIQYSDGSVSYAD